MSSWFAASPESLLAIALTAVGVYAAVLAYTQLAGLRSYAKMSSYDFAMTVAIGSIIASSVLTESPSLVQAVVALGMIFGLQYLVGRLRRQLPWFKSMVDNQPVLLMKGDTFLRDAMRQERVTEDDLWAKLRQAGVLDLSQVQAVVLETTGDVSVLTGTPGEESLEPRLLTGVRGVEEAMGVEVDLRPGTD